MKPADNIENWLIIWASFARQNADVGWYKQQPWYTDAHLVWPNEARNEHDRDRAHQVEKVVEKIAKRDPSSYTIIRQYYGAYLGAHPDKAVRVAQLTKAGWPKREIYRTVAEVKRIIEGAVMYA